MTRSSKPRIVYLLPLAIIVLTGAFFTVVTRRDKGSRESSEMPPAVTDGRNYYVFVRSLEISPKKPSGKSWDSFADEAPDPYYEIHWRDNRIFASSTQRDQLIGNWSPLGVDTVKSIREGRLSVDSVIKAAAIRASPREHFELRVYDDDPLSQDAIATLTFSLSELTEGDNAFTYEPTESNSIIRLRLALVNADLPLVAQVEQILNPQ